jgi:hypothetical protein
MNAKLRERFCVLSIHLYTALSTRPFDTRPAVPHSGGVIGTMRRMASVLCVLALGISALAPCAGWLRTPEARVACCEQDGGCAMHAARHQNSPHARVTQMEADGCCASSETDDSTPSAPSYAATVTPAVLATAIPSIVVDAAAYVDAWRALVPVPATPVAKHLLFSVFLV